MEGAAGEAELRPDLGPGRAVGFAAEAMPREAHEQRRSTPFDLDDNVSISAVVVGAGAVALELALRSGVFAGFGGVSVWRHFVWYLTVMLVVLRLWIAGVSKLGAMCSIKVTTFLVKLVVAPGGLNGDSKRRWRSSCASLIIGRSAGPGGILDVEEEMLEMLMGEAEGLSSSVWILGAALLAAVQAELPLGGRTSAALRALEVLVAWRMGVLVCRAMDIVCRPQMLSKRSVAIDSATLKGFLNVAKAFALALVGLLLLSRAGYDVSAALTGFGITSLLLGLSSQTILQNFFSWLVLMVQKPFVVGDFVSIQDGANGWVERIDYMMTWLRLPCGDLEVFSNKDVAQQKVRNLSDVPRRRADLSFEVSALSPVEALGEVPGLVRAAVEAQADCEYQNCWLEGTVDFGFRFSFQYFANLPDVQDARTAGTEIWLRLLRALEEKGLQLAAAERLRRYAGCCGD